MPFKTGRLKNICSMMLTAISACSFLMDCSATSSNSDASPVTPMSIPLGSSVNGVTLSGSLAGKSVYLLPSNMNPSGCWIDSQFWTGRELFFGISSIDWTALNNGSLNYNGGCSPSPAFVAQAFPGTTGNFNIYRAVISGPSWTLTNMTLNNSQTVGLSALKIASAAATTAFVKYEKASGNGNIYLTQRLGDNSFSAPTAFTQNSANCDDDNPMLSASGAQLIFTSSRTAANGSTCSGVALKTFWSSSLSGSWQIPVGVTVSPSPTGNVDQAWLDTSGTKLYWTANGTDCSSGPVTTCIRTANGSGTTFTTSPAQIATPLAFGSWPTTTGTIFVSHIGQFTITNGVGFAVCGVSSFVGSSASSGLTTLSGQSVYQAPNSPSPPYYYYHTDFRSCVIQ